MAIRPITFLNDARLREKTILVNQFDKQLQSTIDDMFETMYATNGIGLAATQIGLNQKIAVIDVGLNHSVKWCLINPEIIWREGEALLEEGCLSIPGPRAEVPRALKVGLKAMDNKGKTYEIEADGLLAHCIQHELDHLAGKLFIDYLSPFKQQRAHKQFQKASRKL